MKKTIIKMLGIAAIVCITCVTLVACGNKQTVTWFAPMMAINIDEDAKEGDLYNGPAINALGGNPVPAAHRGKIGTMDGNEFTAAEFTGDELVEGNAIKATLNFAYKGDEEYVVRFTFAVSKVNSEGHGATALADSTRESIILILYEEDGCWWNARRAALGTQYTGGEVCQPSDPEGDEFYAFVINKDNAADFAYRDFYIIGLEEGEYVITIRAELPDEADHFHAFEVLASVSTMVCIGDAGHSHE